MAEWITQHILKGAFWITIIFLGCFGQYIPANAQATKRVYITENHIESLISYTLQPERLKILNLSGVPLDLHVSVLYGQFRIEYYIQPQTAKSPFKRSYDYIWITPILNNGQISCTITKIQIGAQIMTAAILKLPNIYLTSIDATPYCDLFLAPFLKGYGINAQIVSLKLQNNMVWLDIGGTIAPDAPPPVVVAQCTVYVSTGIYHNTTINLRSGPSYDAPILRTLFSKNYEDVSGKLISWQGDWVEINIEGQIGWVWKHYAWGGQECSADYFRPYYDAWQLSATP
jgi:hypothetical protein